MKNAHKRGRLVSTSIAALICAVLCAACSSAGNSASGDPASSGSSQLSKVNAQLSAAEKVPTFVAPGSPINARKILAGKTVLSIPISDTIPFDQAIEQGMQQAVTEAGGKFVEWKNQGQVNQWSSGIQQGTAQKASLIDVEGGADPRLLAPQIQQARSAGISVVPSLWSDSSQKLPAYLKASVPDPFYEAGQLMAGWTIAKTASKANVLIITDYGAYSTNAVVSGLKQEYAAYCPSCHETFLNAPFNTWATNLQTEVESAIAANPSLNYIVPIYDGMTEFVVPAIAQRQAQNNVKIATFNGTPFVLDDIAKGEVQMDIGQDTAWMADATVDYDMRLMAHDPLPQDVQTPLYIWTKSNVSAAGTPAQVGQGYGNAYAAGYAKLWGLSR